MVNSIADNYDSKARRMRGVLTELGVDVGKAATRDGAGAMGGPFVPAQVPKDAMGFERQLHRIEVTRAQITRLTRTLGAVPVRKPIDGEIDLQSGFGVRVDPFLGSPAMHTGLDLHGETGDAVRATADGTVTAAGWSGGYGRVVDVDHGNGLVDALRPLVVDRRSRRPVGQDRADHRQGRLDRPLDRTAPALRDAGQRRGGRPAEIPARGTKARRRPVRTI